MGEILTLFTRAAKLTRGAADETMSRHGVRVGQNLVLEVLWDTDGLTPGEIAERLHVTGPTIVKSAARMELSGLVVRRADDEDRRLVRVYLTEYGRTVQSVIEDAWEKLEQRATATLTDSERRALLRSLRKIIHQLADAPPVD